MKEQTALFTGRLIWCAGLIALLACGSTAQQNPNCPPEDQSCGLCALFTSVPVQQLSISDIDFEHFQSRTLMFTISMKSYSIIPVNAILDLKLDIQLADGPPLPSPSVHFKTKPFEIPRSPGPGIPGERTITNLDIGQTVQIDGSVDISQEARDRIEHVALSTGKFPSGKYDLTLSVTRQDCSISIDDRVPYLIQNVSRVELRSPRDGETTNEYPLFEFFSDGSKSQLTVAEKAPDQTREEAISRKPPMLDLELNDQNSFLYSGGRPLEQGKTYVWQVVSKSLVAGGTNVEVASAVGLFTVSNAVRGTAEDAILNQVEEMLGSRYAAVFEQIRKSGLTLTGTYSNNSTPLSQSELLNLLNELRQIADSIDLTLE